MLVSSLWGGACGQSTLVLRPVASRRPPNRGLSCSIGTCAAAHWRQRMLALTGKVQRKDGWPLAVECPEPSSCRLVVAQQRWRTYRARGSGECSLSLPHTTPTLNWAGMTKHLFLLSRQFKDLANVLNEVQHRFCFFSFSQNIHIVILETVVRWFIDMYLQADFSKLCLDFFHQTHIPVVNKILPTPFL